jgi:hypothetical protein
MRNVGAIYSLDISSNYYMFFMRIRWIFIARN